MNDKMKTSTLNEWIERETLFLRGAAIALLVTTVLSVFHGLLENPDNSGLVNVFNFLLTMLMAVLGLVALLWSISRDRMARMVDSLTLQSPGRSIAVAVIQGIGGLLFLLEGLGRMRLSLIMLSLIMIAAAFWYYQRSAYIRSYQQKLDNIDLFAES